MAAIRARNHYPVLSYLLILPAFVLVVGLLLVPMSQNVYYSFYKWNGLSKPLYIGFKNYLTFFADSNFIRSFVNTLLWVAATIVFPVLGGLAIANFLRGLRLATLFKTIFFIPLTISFVATGAIWSNMFSRDLGVINGIVALFRPGFKLSWLTSVPLNTFAMIIAWVWQQLGTSMVLFLAGLSTIPRDPVEASILDGASKWQTFRHVTLPMLQPVTTVVITMAMVNSFKTFDIIYVMTRGGPYRSSETLAITMFRESFTMFNMGYGAAISVLLSILVILVSVFYIKSMWKKDLLYY
ncbi:MAG: sugar ABC transporter permease [Treponema sp.]|nr:sugar ABC transporter permease [Treponema sp.]